MDRRPASEAAPGVAKPSPPPCRRVLVGKLFAFRGGRRLSRVASINMNININGGLQLKPLSGSENIKRSHVVSFKHIKMPGLAIVFSGCLVCGVSWLASGVVG